MRSRVTRVTTEFAFKRYLMSRPLNGPEPVPDLPAGLHWIPWDPAWLTAHAEVMRRAFAGEIDSRVFPNLAGSAGCLQLMEAISAKAGFRAEATWLVGGVEGFVGTVQGLKDANGEGAIQNLGVVPEFRSRGLGKALLFRALDGFRRSGLQVATLQVTARNSSAVRMYARWGFEVRRTVFRTTSRRP